MLFVTVADVRPCAQLASRPFVSASLPRVSVNPLHTMIGPTFGQRRSRRASSALERPHLITGLPRSSVVWLVAGDEGPLDASLVAADPLR